MSTLDAPMSPPEGFTAEQFDDFARRWLEEHGYVVKLPQGVRHMKVRDLIELTKLSYAGLSKRLNHALCPPWRAWRGETGRLVRVRVTPALREFLCAPKQPGIRPKPHLALAA